MSICEIKTAKKTINKKMIIETILFLTYTILTFIGAVNHELWIDEAQAWNIARDNDYMGIVEAMRYEGHPPLWHFVLHIFTNLGCSWRVLPIISWAFNVATVALIVYKFPFHILLKAAIIFSSGFLFYNSIISRVYCMIPLILCCIALLYPKRKEHALLYGTVVALLANTHIFMCGIVGALGILMLVDLFKDWKKNTAGKNALNIIGLVVAAVGVLVLVFMTFGSLENNSDFEQQSFSLYYIIQKYLFSFENIAVTLVSNIKGYTFASSLWCIPIKALLIGMILLLIRRRRAFLIEILFIIFYIFVCEVIWVTLPNRAAIFLFSYAFVLYIAGFEEPASVRKINFDKIKSKLIHKIAGLISKIYSRDLKVFEAALCITFALTIPIGALYLIQDYYRDFNVWKKVSEAIVENDLEDAVIVTIMDGNPELSAYLPEQKIYSIVYGEYYSYVSHKKRKPHLDYDAIYDELSKYDKVYYVISSQNKYTEQKTESPIIVVREGLKLFANMNYAELYEFDADMLRDIVDDYNERNKVVGDVLNTEQGETLELDDTLADAIKKELEYSEDYKLTSSDLEKVTYLGIFEDEITSLKGVSLLTNLSEIHINNGSITDISELNGLESLTCVDISNCYITMIPDLTACTMLETLYLSRNLIEDISMLNKMETLKYISLDGNRIQNIAQIKDWTKVDSLGIDNNCILDYETIADNDRLIAAINYGSQGQYEQCVIAENKAKEIAASFSDNISELELEKNIYQYVIDNMEFEVVSRPMSAFGYHGLTSQVGVCGDYAEVFCLIARHAGLEAYACESETHAWNIVRIDGQYYHCDALWDEPEEEWKHFNLKGSVIMELPDHKYDITRYPDCN